MVLVGLLSFSSYFVDPNSIGDRQSVVLTLVLTTVAFRFVTVSMLPEIPYLTMLDVVIYGCLLLQALMLVAICVVAVIKDEGKQRLADNIAFGTLTFLFLSLFGWFSIWFVITTQRREKYLNECRESFAKTFDRTLFQDDESIHLKDLATPPGEITEFSPSLKRSIRRRSNVNDFFGKSYRNPNASENKRVEIEWHDHV